MFFRDHDGSGFLCRFGNGVPVQRFNGVKIQNARRNSFGFQSLRRFNRFGDKKPRGDNRHVISFDELNCFANFEFLIGVVNHRTFRAAGANKHRADVFRRVHADEPEASDDSTFVAMAGGTVVVVPGEARAHKITTASDLVVLRAMLMA